MKKEKLRILSIAVLILLLGSPALSETASDESPSYLILVKGGTYLLVDSEPITERGQVLFYRNNAKQQLPASLVLGIFEPFEMRRESRQFRNRTEEGARKTRPVKPIQEIASAETEKDPHKNNRSTPPLVLTDESIERTEAGVFYFGEWEVRVELDECKLFAKGDRHMYLNISCINRSNSVRKARVSLRILAFNKNTFDEFRENHVYWRTSNWYPGYAMEDKRVLFRVGNNVTCDQVAFRIEAETDVITSPIILTEDLVLD